MGQGLSPSFNLEQRKSCLVEEYDNHVKHDDNYVTSGPRPSIFMRRPHDLRRTMFCVATELGSSPVLRLLARRVSCTEIGTREQAKASQAALASWFWLAERNNSQTHAHHSSERVSSPNNKTRRRRKVELN